MTETAYKLFIVPILLTYMYIRICVPSALFPVYVLVFVCGKPVYLCTETRKMYTRMMCMVHICIHVRTSVCMIVAFAYNNN